MHGFVWQLVSDVLGTDSHGPLFQQLIRLLPRKLVEATIHNQTQSTGLQGKRLGYMGFVPQMIARLEEIALGTPDGIVAEALDSCDGWDLCQKEAEKYHVASTTQIGGPKYVPQRNLGFIDCTTDRTYHHVKIWMMNSEIHHDLVLP